MEFADIVIDRIGEEDNPKKSFNALVTFTTEDYALALNKIVKLMITGRQKRSSVSLLNLLSDKQAQKIEDVNVYKANLFTTIFGEKDETEKITLKTFVKASHNHSEDTLKTAEEQSSDMIFMGVGRNIFSTELWGKYIKLKQNNLATEEDFITELGEIQTKILKTATTLLNKSDRSVGILAGSNFNRIENIFVPILREEDILTFTTIHQIAKNNGITITVWDSIGIIENNPKIQKAFTTISKKAESKISIWNNNKKITVDFMREQDLMLIARTGWERLICTPLCWINDMPPTLILKDKKI